MGLVEGAVRRGMGVGRLERGRGDIMENDYDEGRGDVEWGL